jgi:hypothetical protein
MKGVVLVLLYSQGTIDFGIFLQGHIFSGFRVYTKHINYMDSYLFVDLHKALPLSIVLDPMRTVSIASFPHSGVRSSATIHDKSASRRGNQNQFFRMFFYRMSLKLFPRKLRACELEGCDRNVGAIRYGRLLVLVVQRSGFRAHTVLRTEVIDLI